jgi:hypothetical protein
MFPLRRDFGCAVRAEHPDLNGHQPAMKECPHIAPEVERSM